MIHRQHFDVLVLGAGIAGATAALALADGGWQVCLVSQDVEDFKANTPRAQGGIVYFGKGDSPELLKKDILAAGGDRCYQPAVELLVQRGPELVKKILIEKLQVPFDRLSDGSFHFTEEGAHSVPRILHVQDQTGLAIHQQYLKHLRNHPNITMVSPLYAIDLLTSRHHSSHYAYRYHLENECVGAYLLDPHTLEVETVFADFTLLATGGVGGIYLHTTNHPEIIGSGMVMAYRAGAYILNAEYIQFHPTALYTPGKERFLISEALRGEGARLQNLRGEYFMDRYDPELKDLAPRDIVARAIVEEMTRHHHEYVYLDLANHYRGSQPIRERFPQIYKKCLSYGINIEKDPIPVVPAAHYFIGGVVTNGEGKTTIQRLYAAGEVACTGLHGANRLASTSLLEGLVWGYAAAESIDKALKGNYKVRQDLLESIPDWVHSGKEDLEDPALILQDWNTIRSTMWNYVGIVRTRDRLKRAVADMVDLGKRLEEFYHEARISPGIISLFQGNKAAQIIAQGALQNTRSAGAHYRKS